MRESFGTNLSLPQCRPRSRPPATIRTPTLPRSAGQPIAVAITGGIGAGKSETLRAFARHGAAVVSSDEIVHHLLRHDDAVKAALIGRFGEEILGPDGEIDRKAVGKIVFAEPSALAWLESILHPRVSATYLGWRDELAAQPDPPSVCVTEVPLLYETGGESRFDAVVAITAAPDKRIARTIHADIGRREQRLLPDTEKMRRADFSYVNDGTLEELDAFVAEVMSKLAEKG
jgi:dephospho-CoA kinase